VLVVTTGPHVGRVQLIRGSAAATLHVEPKLAGIAPKDDAALEALLSVGDVNGDGHDDVVMVAAPSVGYRRTYALHLGAKTGLQALPFATYTVGAGERVPHADRPGGAR
jgi:FG-GAP repeat